MVLVVVLCFEGGRDAMGEMRRGVVLVVGRMLWTFFVLVSDRLMRWLLCSCWR